MNNVHGRSAASTRASIDSREGSQLQHLTVSKPARIKRSLSSGLVRSFNTAARAAASRVAVDQRVLFDSVTATRLHADVQRSFPRAAVSEHRDWCSHLVDLRLIQERLSISDTVLFYNVAQTLKGNLLHTWRGFMLTTLDKVEMAAPDDPFPWPLAFEHLVVTPADFLRSEASCALFLN